MVGAVRFELTTSCTPSKRATKLRYAPDHWSEDSSLPTAGFNHENCFSRSVFRRQTRGWKPRSLAAKMTAATVWRHASSVPVMAASCRQSGWQCQVAPFRLARRDGALLIFSARNRVNEGLRTFTAGLGSE